MIRSALSRSTAACVFFALTAKTPTAGNRSTVRAKRVQERNRSADFVAPLYTSLPLLPLWFHEPGAHCQVNSPRVRLHSFRAFSCDLHNSPPVSTLNPSANPAIVGFP